MNQLLKGFLGALVLTLGACSDKQSADFEFTYSMESINNYKMTITLKSDSTYAYSTHNFFMDTHAGKAEPETKTGKLSNEELKELKQLLKNANLFNMKDSYGFEDESADFQNIIYNIQYRDGEKKKEITIRPSETNSYSTNYLKLMIYINNLIKKFT
jgi:hypothetical protein